MADIFTKPLGSETFIYLVDKYLFRKSQVALVQQQATIVKPTTVDGN